MLLLVGPAECSGLVSRLCFAAFNCNVMFMPNHSDEAIWYLYSKREETSPQIVFPPAVSLSNIQLNYSVAFFRVCVFVCFFSSCLTFNIGLMAVSGVYT